MSKSIYCPVCSTKLHRKDIECCSKSCSAKLHWSRHPEMKESRSVGIKKVNSNPFTDEHKKNISKARMGKAPWNKGKKGVQGAWNKGLPAEQQPFYGKVHSSESNNKRSESIQKLIAGGMRFQDFGEDKNVTTTNFNDIILNEATIKHLDILLGV